MDEMNDKKIRKNDRIVQGATSVPGHINVTSSSAHLEGKTKISEHIDFAPCPPEFESFLDKTSLEKLVYWKLQKLVERVVSVNGDSLSDDLNLLKHVLVHIERPLFALVLKKTCGNLSRAANILGCNRNTLHRKLREFSLEPKELRRLIKMRSHQKSENIHKEQEF